MVATLIGKAKGLRLINAALLILATGLVVAGACNFAPETPAIDRTTLWMDTVKRGDLVIERRGAGQLVASETGELYAQIRVPETQSLDLEVGEAAIVDLRIAEAPARIAELGDRIVQGVRIVRLEFTEALPEAALPGMSVDAMIQHETIEDVLFVGKPAYARANSRIALFKLVDDGDHAERVAVRMGRSSVNLIEISEGLVEGDQIILSDMSRWDAFDRVAMR
jgi:HlyD family secretion protein